MGEIYFRFYPRNWRAAVRGLTPLAKAVWHDMTLAMREANPRGFFVGASGEPIDIRAFAKDNDYKPAEVRKAFAELQAKNLYSIDSIGRIYCRFIVREVAREEQARENGSLGGNPMLTPLPVNPKVKPNGLTRLVNHSDKSGVKVHAIAIKDQDQATDSLRSSAVAFGTWPDDVATLKGLALLFVAAFANCRDPLKAEKHLGYYTAVLAQMRSRRVSIATAWQACEDALEANGGKPLWSAAIKTAISFLPLVPRTIAPAECAAPAMAGFIADLRSQEGEHV